jgi:SAM-dependent methyltransferase
MAESEKPRMQDRLKRLFPWWAKLSLKMLASRIPLKEKLFHPLGIYQHGFMIKPTYAINVFEFHLSRWEGVHPPGFHVLELGPGDSVSTAIVAAASGAASTTMIDVSPAASMRIEDYPAVMNELESRKYRVPPAFKSAKSMDELLKLVHGTYLVEGLKSLQALPSNSVDFCFSNAVLEHLSLHEVIPTIQELHRVLKPGGVMSHTIDFRDHLDQNLHSLRFAEHDWETKLVVQAGFYTNRWRINQFYDAFKEAGFVIKNTFESKWQQLPITRSRLNAQFRQRDDLLVYTANVVCEK